MNQSLVGVTDLEVVQMVDVECAGDWKQQPCTYDINTHAAGRLRVDGVTWQPPPFHLLICTGYNNFKGLA